MTEYEDIHVTFKGINGIKGFSAFTSSGDHIKFERYDTDKKTEGFETMCNEGKLGSMIAHRKLTQLFDWHNFNKWLEHKEKTT